MRTKLNSCLAMLVALSLCLTLLPTSVLAATMSGTSVTELGTGAYSITLKNNCSESVQYSVTAGEVSNTVTLGGYENLILKGDAGESYSVTWQGGANLSTPADTTKTGTFGQAATGYDGFDGADSISYNAEQVSNSPLKSSHYGYTYDVNFYYVTSKLVTYYSYPNSMFVTTQYYYQNEADSSESYSGRGRGDARNALLSSKGLSSTDEGTKWIDYDRGDKTGCLWLITQATPYIAFDAYTTNTYTLSLVNSCAASVQYKVTIGDDTQTVTLGAGETKEFEAAQGTAYIIEWMGGTDTDYFYIAPTVTKYEGQFGVNTQTVYYLEGQKYTGQVSDTLTYNGYTMSAGTMYAVDTLTIFTRTKNGTRYVYTNTEDAGEYYSATSASGARDNIKASYPDYTVQADSNDLGYAWVFKPVTSQTETTDGDATVTVTTTAVKADKSGSFKVAALNVDGMPQNVRIANVYDLKLNEDGPGAEGSTSIGAYIEDSDIDLLALSEDFNFYNEINAAAPSYATMTQRASIPTEVGLGSLNNSLFPFDTDGLNLMYKSNLTVTGESMTAWNEHYSPTTNYVVIDVPDQNGADGMIDKGFRFYQAQVAPGVVVDVYILHMDAETDPGDNAARASQIDQLMAAVEANDNDNPIIIMGDTNCRYTRDPLEEKIIGAGFSDPWIDLERDGVYPQVGDSALMVTDPELGYQKGEVVDKVFYRNVAGNPLQITASDYFVDAEGYTDEGGLLGDHPPVIVTFDYSFTANTVAHEHNWAEGWTYDGSGHWHECLNNNCDVTMNSQKDGYATHTFTEDVTTEPTCTETGVKTYTCSVCGYTKTEVIPNTGHTWDEGVVTTEPTATTDGVKTYTCTVCHITRTESIPATGEPEAARNYTFEVRFDQEAYNVGDTVTADIYVKSDDQGANFGTVGFKLSVPDGLSLVKLDSALTGGSVSTNGGNYAYNVNSETPVTVDANGVKLATATFTVNSFAGDTSSVALDLSDCELTEINQQNGAASTHSGAVADLYNLKVTLNPGDNATINGQDTALTLYAKYNESGLYSDESRKTTASAPELAAKTGYRLADTQWTNGMADFDAIAGQTFTESKEYTVETVKTWTVTFQASNVTFAAGAQTTVTVDDGTTFGQVAKPDYTVNPHYTFLGWYNGETQMADGTVINGDLIVTATAVAASFNFTEISDNAAVTVTSGVTDSKASYNTDITFTVTPDSGYVISDVSYTVGEDNTAYTLRAVNGVYTIPGSAITDDITVEVNVTKYYTITFVAGTGVTMDTATAYVREGEAALYTSTSFNTTFTVPTPTPQDGYRLANDTVMEPLWSSGTFGYQNSAVGSNAYFHRDTTLTAQAVKQWTVTFVPGTNGSFAEGAVTELTVDVGTVLTEAQIPSVTANTGYTFTGWSSSVTTAITHDVTFTAQYAKATYTLTLPTVDGISFKVEGATLNSDGTYTVTYDTPVTITMTATGTNVTGVSYTIGDGTAVSVENFNEPFTIPGSSITGAISLNVQSHSTYQITVTVEGGNGTVNGKTSDTLTFAYNTSAADVAQAFNIVSNPGYTFTAPAFAPVTDNATYTVTFTPASYDVTGVEGTTSATYGQDVTFKPELSGQLLLGVQYKVGQGQFITLTADEDGNYTIPGDAITGPITVQYTTVTGSLAYIAAEDYAAAPAGEKVAVLNTAKLATGTYALDGYGDMFWSEKYSAYVCFVDNDETAATLTEKLAVSTNNVTEISYTGDINGSGSVTPADSAAINAVLHGVAVEYSISDLMRFQFDVMGDRLVSVQDITWILNRYTGASQSE